MSSKRVQEIESARERVTSIRAGQGKMALYLSTQELCPLIRLPKPTLNGWVMKGWLTPAVKGAGGRNHPSYWDGWQCVGLAVVASCHDKARAKNTILGRGIVELRMQAVCRRPLEELYETVRSQDHWDEATATREVAELVPQMTGFDQDEIDRIDAVLRFLKRHLAMKEAPRLKSTMRAD